MVNGALGILLTTFAWSISCLEEDVIAGPSRSKNDIASLGCAPAIHHL
jgi:hypothetical protein